MKNAALVGRASELAALREVLAGLGRGRSSCVSIAGEAGIGKTHLLEELCRWAREAGHTVLVGQGTEFEREVPFGLLVDALDGEVSSLPPTRIAELGGEQLAELALVFPSLADLGGQLATPLQVERARSHHAVRALLEQLAAQAPVVLALDDVHWADPASIEVLAHLMRRPPRTPVLIVIAHHPRRSPARLRLAMEAVGAQDLLVELALSALTQAEAHELLGTDLSPATRQVLYRESGGNPFYMQERARALRLRRRASLATSSVLRDAGIPAVIVATISEELAGVSRPALTLLKGAAVAGEPFEPWLAARAADLDDADVLGALDELFAAELVRPGDGAGRLSLRHPILRHAVYELAGYGWRLGAHARMARALGERGAGPADRAHHLERSAAVGDEEAIRVLTEAARGAAPRAPVTAARWFAAALRLLPDERDDRRLELLISLASALGAAGRMIECRTALTDVLRLLPAHMANGKWQPGSIRGRILGSIAQIDHVLGRGEDARALLLQALDELGDREPATCSALHLELAVDRWFTAEWEEMAASAGQALTGAVMVGDRPLQAEAVALRAVAEFNKGSFVRAVQSVHEAERTLAALSDANLGVRARTLLFLGHTSFGMEHIQPAIAHLERGLRITRATNQGHLFIPLTVYLAVCKLWEGRLAEAAGDVEAAVDAALVLGNPQSLSWALSLRCWIDTLRGDLPAAISAGEQAVDALTQAPTGMFAWLSTCCLAQALFESGQPDAARERLLAGGGGPSLTALEPPFRATWFELLALIALERGRVHEAQQWATRTRASATEFGLPSRVARGQRAQAAVLLARGNPATASKLAGRATETLRRQGQRLEAARATVLLGRALAAAGEHDAGVSELERAYADFGAIGAERYRDQAARELRGLGRRVARTGRRGEGGGMTALSAREREVAELVAQGMTNRRIAAELFLSDKTVETHLSRAFAKLGLSSRAALAGALERERAQLAHDKPA